jgi:thioesterase domain-containing protein
MESAQKAAGAATGDRNWSPDWPALMTVQPGGLRPPLFFVSPGLGWEARDLSRHLGPDQPVYALRPPGRLAAPGHRPGVPELANRYVEELLEARPEGPYVLAGGCSAGVVAFEMAQQLRAAGAGVPLLMLFDVYFPPPRGLPLPLVRLVLRLPRTIGRLQMLTPSERRDYARERAGFWLRRWLSVLRRGPGVASPEAWDDGFVPAPYLSGHTRLLGPEDVWRYVARPYRGRLVLFLSEGTASWPFPDRRLQWRQVAVHGCEVHALPGWHEESLEEPHVRVTATKVRACISSCMAARGA